VLTFLVAVTASPVAAGTTTVAPHPRSSSGTPQAVGGPTGPDSEGANGGLTDDLASVQWEQAEQHAMDVIAFQPGGRVDVPFKPEAGDPWTVDGAAPQTLPPGLATGRQMRDAAQGSTWSNGDRAADVDSRRERDGLDESVDQPIAPVGAAAAPASFVASDPSPSGGEGVQDAAAVSSGGLRREIFGFLPYWEMNAPSTTLDWRTLSTVAYFSVGCNSNGSLAKRNPDGSATVGWAGWTSSKMTSIINSAHAHHTRVVLTVSCFAWNGSGASAQAALLRSSTARATLARQIAAAVRDRGADGVNLDFEPIVAGYADEFTALVRKVRAELNNVAKGYQLTFDAMASIANQPIAAATAPGGADAVFVMGYDYRTAGAATAGSISPLTGPSYDLTDTVDAFLAKVSPSKVILGVPYYGRAWSTASSAVHAQTLPGSKYGASAVPLYTQAVEFAQAHGRRWDPIEQSPWTVYRKQTCTSAYGCVASWRQLYYDDSTSLKRRYDLVNREHLRGVGIWALGFEGTRPELRNALAEKFLADTTPPVVGIVTLAPTQHDEAFPVAWQSWDDSPIAGYDVEVSFDAGPWHVWMSGTTATSGLFRGHDGHAYAFRVRAWDSHRNISGWSGASSVPTVAIPSGIKVGSFATVRTDGLHMRTSPATGAMIMTTLRAGDALRVIGGPVKAAGYTWFRVTGPINQWGVVDNPQVGGWIAAYGNGVVNARPRRAVYATAVRAGITGLRLNDGGLRVLTTADRRYATLRVTWRNRVTLDSLSLRVFRLNGTVVGSVGLRATGTGSHAYAWNGRIGGSRLPAGAYVLQLRGTRGSTIYSAPSARAVAPGQVTRSGFMVSPAVPTALRSFTSTPASPTRSGSPTFRLVFGGPVHGLAASDISRTGTAAGCRVGAPTGSGATWTIAVTGCGAGTVQLTLRSAAVADAVSNLGPATATAAPRVVIDRTAPIAAKPRLELHRGIALGSSSLWAILSTTLRWSATDAGSAGISDFDVRRSVDGGAWSNLAIETKAHAMPVVVMPGHTYRFEVRATDRAGNVGDWAASAPIGALLRQDSSGALAWSGSWAGAKAVSYSGGSVMASSSGGATMRYAFTGRSIGVVLTRRPSGGKVKVYLDGTYITTIDTAASVLACRQLMFVRSWATSGRHSLRLVVVVATAGHARVDVDALAILG
jgi:spore germination protein YaaH